MLAWMRSFGELRRIGIESTGSYGLLRFMRQARVPVLARQCFAPRRGKSHLLAQKPSGWAKEVYPTHNHARADVFDFIERF